MRKKSANANQKQTNQHSSNQRPGVRSAAQYPLSQQSAHDGLRGVYRDDPEKEGRESNEHADQSHHRYRCANQNSVRSGTASFRTTQRPPATPRPKMRKSCQIRYDAARAE